MRQWSAFSLGLCGLLILSVSLRLAYQGFLTATPAYRHPAVDAGYHCAWARGIAFGEWDNPDHEIRRIPAAPYFRPPGYPYFLAGIHTVLGSGYLAPRLVQSLLGILSLGMFAWFVLRWYGRATCLLGTALMGTYWGFIYFEGEFLEVPLLVFCAIALVAALAEIPRTRGMPGICGWAALAGLMLGIHAVTRPNILLFAPVAAIWAGWRVLSRGHELLPAAAAASARLPDSPLRPRAAVIFRRALPVMAMLTLGTLAVILPCSIRNWVVGRERVLISANGGVNLYIGNNDYAGGLFVGSTQEFGAFGTSSKYEDLMAGVAAKTGKKMGYREVDAYFAELARRWIAANPGKAARLTLRKFLYLVSGWETGHNRSLYCERRALPVIRHLPLGWGGLLSLCLAGLALRERGNRRSPGFSDATQVVLLLSGCYALSFLPFFITGQYRMPLVPWLCLGAAAAVVGAWSFRGESRRLGLALCLLAAGLVLTHVNWLGFQPNWAKWHTDEGMAWDARQEPQKAEACYRKAVAASGQTGMAWMQLGLQATDRKAYQQALECYQQALHTGVPEMHRLYGNIATAYYYAGALKDAILWYEKATANAVEMPEILANYGNALLSLHQYDRALEQFERALSHARRPMPHIALRAGILSWKKGDRTKASRYFNLAEKLRPELRSQIEAAQKADSGI